MADADAVPNALQGAPASAKHVYTILRAADEPLTYGDIQARTGYAQSTVSTACCLLDRRDLAELRRDPDEPRRKLVRPADSRP